MVKRHLAILLVALAAFAATAAAARADDASDDPGVAAESAPSGGQGTGTRALADDDTSASAPTDDQSTPPGDDTSTGPPPDDQDAAAPADAPPADDQTTAPPADTPPTDAPPANDQTTAQPGDGQNGGEQSDGFSDGNAAGDQNSDGFSDGNAAGDQNSDGFSDGNAAARPELRRLLRRQRCRQPAERRSTWSRPRRQPGAPGRRPAVRRLRRRSERRAPAVRRPCPGTTPALRRELEGRSQPRAHGTPRIGAAHGCDGKRRRLAPAGLGEALFDHGSCRRRRSRADHDNGIAVPGDEVRRDRRNSIASLQLLDEASFHFVCVSTARMQREPPAHTTLSRAVRRLPPAHVCCMTSPEILTRRCSVASSNSKGAGLSLGGGLVIAGVVIWFLWSFWLGLIVALVGLVAFGGFVRGRWY